MLRSCPSILQAPNGVRSLLATCTRDGGARSRALTATHSHAALVARELSLDDFEPRQGRAVVAVLAEQPRQRSRWYCCAGAGECAGSATLTQRLQAGPDRKTPGTRGLTRWVVAPTCRFKAMVANPMALGNNRTLTEDSWKRSTRF